MTNHSFLKYLQYIFLPAIPAGILYGAGSEFHNIAWGTGSWLGGYSSRWFLLFSIFIFLCLSIFMSSILFTWQPERFANFSPRLVIIRNQLKSLRWLIAILVIGFPVWFLQYSMWGIVFQGPFIRARIWIAVVLVFAILASQGDTLLGWKEILGGFILTASAFSIAVSLQGVSDYPFSLGWSEGNRLWDYSTLFGKHLYDYPPDDNIYVLLDSGRLLIGGLPFLFPGLTIQMARLWVGLILVIPYFLIGIAAFRTRNRTNRLWPFMILWLFLFLKQGPIHSPLVIAAALTILVWDRSLWISIPIIIYAGYFAQMSRFTWLFAPALWIGMLELAGASLLNGKLGRTHWVRAIALGASGVFGGYLLPKLLPLLNRPAMDVAGIGEQIASSGLNPEFVTNAVSDQPLLWYRLLPNSTYETGILLGLAIAVLPVIILLVWLSAAKKWPLNIWQKLAIVTPLLAFLVVGLIASTKIGGGGDLHNLDMFLIGLAFTAVIAWYHGGREVILNPNQLPVWIKIVVIAALVLPAVIPWRQMRSHQFGEEASTLVVLTDAPDEKSLDLLPSDEKVEHALVKIRDAVAVAKENGEVLFLDQRQLLTFGYVTDVPLVPEYEKKVLMNEALSANAEYFQPFYKDLAAHRFSLIISERLFTPIKDSSFEFGEENNAWVTWVANPLLCYYQEESTLKDVGVQLFVPRETPAECQLP